MAGTAGAAAGKDDVFTLGEIAIVGEQEEEGRPVVGGSIITRDEIWTFQKNSLDEAVNLAPGVVGTLESNGRRNETDIFVRGFGRWQVPLMIDGVRIYLPADNRLDFSRFLTADIAEIQIQKGYASVLDGPGAMGGAINLVTRKPTEPYEAEFQGGFTLGNGGEFQGWNGYAMTGSRQDLFYVQGSINYFNRDFWVLSDDYEPSAISLEDGGKRISSDSEDWRLNLKAGFTPNDTDEYTVNYIRQEGEKGAPLNVYNNPLVPPNSFWRWPWWNIETLSFLSSTQLGEASYVKTKLYYNTFDNALDAFDNITYITQSNNGRFRSIYDDHAYGGSLELGTELIPMNTLKTAFHYREDVHTEWQYLRPSHPTLSSVEPKQDQEQTTWSIALEDTFHVNPNVDLIGGISYEEYQVDKAEDFSSATQSIFEQPKGGADSFNWQAAAIWRYSEAGEAHASGSDRSRFPTIFELYSTRFGTAVPNPNLGPERATNFEIGGSQEVTPGTRVSGAIFYSDVTDLIQTVEVGPGLTQTQNVGDGYFYGVEFSVETRLADTLSAGGNYTFIDRTIDDPSQPNLQPTGVPKHKAFLYVAWEPLEAFTVTPSLEIAGDRWSDVSTNPAQAFPFTRTGAYTLANIQAEYAILDNLELAAGVKNLFDENYELAWGLPQPGRSFYVKGRLIF
ncbi:MAG: TonB-dependent receptor plug domain-containing protein [Alphaproteobacteria bacterium]